MIWGSQWDRTLMWLIESENKTKEEICDSSDWGNYSNNIEEGAGSRRATGYSETWKTANIYDLAGNVGEWTMEASSTNGRVYRGGYYTYTGTDFPAGDRNYSTPTNSYYGFSACRVALYIK